jgi:hypothetical protein
MLVIRYSSGQVVQGALLALCDQKIRVALKGSDDVTEYRLVSQRWVSEDCEVVAIDVAPAAASPAGHEDFLEGIVQTELERPAASHIM